MFGPDHFDVEPGNARFGSERFAANYSREGPRPHLLVWRIGLPRHVLTARGSAHWWPSTTPTAQS